MRIVMDGSPLTVESGGIRRYTEELALALQALDFGDQVYLASDRTLRLPEDFCRSGVQVRDLPPAGWRKRWWSLGASSTCRQVEASVFHGTDFSVPYLHRHPAVITIHDLSPWRFPEWQPGSRRIRRRTPWMLRLGLADMVITMSNAVRDEVISYFGTSADRVAVTPLAADGCFQPNRRNLIDDKSAAPLAFEQQLGGQPFFLFVGTLEPRKNLPMLMAAWEHAQSSCNAALVIAGRLRDDSAAPQRQNGLHWLGCVSDHDLAWLYSRAIAVVYPSYYEGFGLPVIEAMQCGAPVIASQCAAHLEVVADGGLLLAADQPGDWSAAISRMANDAAWRSEYAARALNRAKQFSWRNTALRTREVYQEAQARFGR